LGLEPGGGGGVNEGVGGGVGAGECRVGNGGRIASTGPGINSSDSLERNQQHLSPSQPYHQQQHLHHHHPPPHPPPHPQTQLRPKMDLTTLLNSLGLQKYIAVFEELEVDLPVFLTLTDNDLRECGITLFGPRRKMTSAIARYYSYASLSQSRNRDAAATAASAAVNINHANNNNNNNNNEMSWIESLDWTANPLEKAYADKLEVEMQEMAIRLHQAGRQVEASEANFQQILNFLCDLHKSISDSRKLSRSAVRLTNELDQTLTRIDEDAGREQHQQHPQQYRGMEDANVSSLIPSLLQFHAELESLTSMQRNGIEDLIRKFNRGKGGVAQSNS